MTGAWWVRERGPTVQVLYVDAIHPLTALGYRMLLARLVARHTRVHWSVYSA